MAPFLGGRRGSNAAGAASTAAATSASKTLATNNFASSSSSSSSYGGSGVATGNSSASSNAALASPMPPVPANSASTIRGYHNASQGGMPSSTTVTAPIHPSSYGTGTMSYSPNRNAAPTQSKFITKGGIGNPNNSSSPHSYTSSTLSITTEPTIQGIGYKSIDTSSIGDTSLSPNASPSAASIPSFPTSAQSSVNTFAHGNHSGMLDQISLNSNNLPSSLPSNSSASYLTPNHAIQPSMSSSLSDTPLRETFARRIRTLAYIKKTLSADQRDRSNSTSNQAWLDIIRISRQDLDSIYDNEQMRKRAHRYYLLGCSLASTIDLLSASEFARAVLAVIHEVELTADAGEKDKTKMRNFFKSSIRAGTARKSAGSVGLPEFSSTYDGVSVGGPSLSSLGPSGVELVGSHLPFQLDFLQTTITFCDILMEIYCKFSQFFSTSTGLPSQSGMREFDGLPQSGMTMHDNLLSPSPTPITASSIDAMHKVDTKLRKILAQICKEIDGLARQRIREELGSIDPLMAKEIQTMDFNTPIAFGTPQSGSSLNALVHAHDAFPTSVPMTNPSISAGLPIGSMRGSNKMGSIHSNNPNVYAGSAPNLLTTGHSGPAVNAMPNLRSGGM